MQRRICRPVRGAGAWIGRAELKASGIRWRNATAKAPDAASSALSPFSDPRIARLARGAFVAAVHNVAGLLADRVPAGPELLAARTLLAGAQASPTERKQSAPVHEPSCNDLEVDPNKGSGLPAHATLQLQWKCDGHFWQKPLKAIAPKLHDALMRVWPPGAAAVPEVK